MRAEGAPDEGGAAPAARVGLLGGTFDPPHVGHVVAACWVRHALTLDEVRLVVANAPWQKTGERVVTPATVRLAMVEAALAGTHGLVTSDLELRRGGPTYTVDTLEELHATEPGVQWFVVVGSDAAAGLPTWHRWQELPSLATFVVVSRAGSAPPPELAGFAFEVVEIPTIAVTSTMVRSRVAAGAPIDGLTPAQVSSLIAERGLYRGEVHERPTAH